MSTRDPAICYRCGEVCVYDGSDHVHVDTDLGIGSCRPRLPQEQDPRDIDDDPDEDDGRQIWWPGYVVTHDDEERENK